MKRFVTGLMAVVFLIVFAGMSSAGMMDALKGKAEEAQAQAGETMESKEAEGAQSIEAQGAAKEEGGNMGGSMMDQVKEGAKEKTNEMIDNVGK